MQILKTTYLSLGSNLGDKLHNLQEAVYLIARRIGVVVKVSSVYETGSWGFKSENFYNSCIAVTTNLPSEQLLNSLLQIEQDLGRIRETTINGYAARSIDIDILLYNDEVIDIANLKVPHPSMLNRKFVLVPLAEIASSVIHSITNQTILECLQNCEDSSDVQRIDKNLIRPISFVEKYNYIAIEGNIGAGKTSLSKMIGNEYNAKLVLERFADNPFLPKYYKNMDRYAFPLEMSFLADRYQQLTDDLAQFDLFKNFIVSDYYIFKSLIFAQVSLSKEEYALYRRMFDIMYKEITKPDLYIYLYQNTERLLDNIKKRGRDYEQNIAPEYLEKIHQGYSGFIKTEQNLNTLVIDVSELDFVNTPADYEIIIKKINDFKVV